MFLDWIFVVVFYVAMWFINNYNEHEVLLCCCGVIWFDLMDYAFCFYLLYQLRHIFEWEMNDGF